MKETPLKRRSRKVFGDAQLWAQFKFGVAQADDFTCVMVGRSVCDGKLEAAHVLPKQRLKRAGYGAEVIYSLDAAFTLCARHHNRHDRGLERVPEALVPERCRRFAVAYGKPAAPTVEAMPATERAEESGR